MPLPARNHNPVWIVDTEQGVRLWVYACDERQAIDWVRIARGLTALVVVRVGTDD